MSEPIFTKVVNNMSIEKVLNWAGNDSIVVPANGETVVPYEVWSKADAGQRESILAAVGDGSICMTVGVLSTGGEYVEVPFNPCEAAAAISVAAPVLPTDTKAVNGVLDFVDDNSHVIVAKSDTTQANKDYYSVKSVPIEPIENFKVEGPATEGFEAEAVENDAEDEFEKKFMELVANKAWNDALSLLKDKFGDKITFGVRVIMSMKDYKAIVAKYKLAE